MTTMPEDIHAEFAAAVNAGDFDHLCELFEHGAVVIAPPGEQGAGERLDGIAAIRAHLERLLAMRPEMTIVASQAHRLGDLALLSSHWRADATHPGGRPTEMGARGTELGRPPPDGSWRLGIDNPGGVG